MPSEEHYDDSAFLYFSLSVLTVILIPSSFSYLKKLKKNYFKKSTDYKGPCGCNCLQCKKKAKNILLEDRKPGTWGMFKFTIFILLWIIFFILLRASSQQSLSEVRIFLSFLLNLNRTQNSILILYLVWI